eukprot:gnl/TRDRNA2_/TRDRNA2_158922_c0_seq2.p1 gnl/TRDRNA2_/TRDRNA2_158922_c0~~gnl/TRDRNA2_/TRDRNA2_158922_c0_seq2.p1  ORF type:complete len:203 (-),score=6.86 gnl/TRDRNA2_/TRDRNA2_158922_c0_seq2:28-636(-)
MGTVAWLLVLGLSFCLHFHPSACASPNCTSTPGQYCCNHLSGDNREGIASLDVCLELCLQIHDCTEGYWHPPYEGHPAICKLYHGGSDHQCCDETSHWDVTSTFQCRESPQCTSQERMRCSDNYFDGGILIVIGALAVIACVALCGTACGLGACYYYKCCCWQQAKPQMPAPNSVVLSTATVVGQPVDAQAAIEPNKVSSET